MYTDRKNVLQLVALLKACGIKHIVLSPGSRNSPLIHTFATASCFVCHSVVDERSAAFYALGVIDAISEPVAVCCTSGTAALNYGPAVAEAFYRQLPLLVITADRPEAHIGQMLGQTIPQPGLFNTLVKKTVHLPDVANEADEWFCNRLINEAILTLDHNGKGPVHINVPISEPLFHYTAEALPTVRKINRCNYSKHFNDYRYIQHFQAYHKRMLLVGQLPPSEELKKALQTVAEGNIAIVLSEHLSNLHTSVSIPSFDQVLASLSPEEKKRYAPELLITFGGHIVSKRMAQFIREYPPLAHWHLSESGEVVDTYGVLTDTIEATPTSFSHAIADHTPQVHTITASYAELWKQTSDRLPAYRPQHAEEEAVQTFLQSLPENSSLHLANSSSVRYAQLFPILPTIDVYCNRGTNGIEGSLSTAVGYAAVSDRQTFLLTGDLSFFYDMNGLWNRQLSSRLRIFLINNGRGNIFYTLKGLTQSDALKEYIAASHHTTAKGWVESLGFTYLSASNQTELKKVLPLLTAPNSPKAILLEYVSEQS